MRIGDASYATRYLLKTSNIGLRILQLTHSRKNNFALCLFLLWFVAIGCDNDSGSNSSNHSFPSNGSTIYFSSPQATSSGIPAIDIRYDRPEDEYFNRHLNLARIDINRSGNPYLLLLFSDVHSYGSYDFHGAFQLVRNSNSEWQATPHVVAGNGQNAVLLLDNTDRAHIVYSKDGPQTGGEIVEYHQFGENVFELVDSRKVSPGYVINDIAMGRDGALHVMHYSYRGPMIYSTNKNGAWENNEFPEHDFGLGSVTVDKNGTVHIVSRDFDSGSIIHLVENENHFVETDIGHFGLQPIIRSDSFGNLVVISSENKTIYLSRLVDNEWTTRDIITENEDLCDGIHVSLEIDGDNNLVLIYGTRNVYQAIWEGTGSYIVGRLHLGFVKAGADGQANTLLIDNEAAYRRVNLSLGPDGTAHVGAIFRGSRDLRYFSLNPRQIFK